MCLCQVLLLACGIDCPCGCGSFVAVHGLSSCGRAQASLLWGTWDLSSLTRGSKLHACIARWILNRWTTREVPVPHLICPFTYERMSWLLPSFSITDKAAINIFVCIFSVSGWDYFDLFCLEFIGCLKSVGCWFPSVLRILSHCLCIYCLCLTLCLLLALYLNMLDFLTLFSLPFTLSSVLLVFYFPGLNTEYVRSEISIPLFISSYTFPLIYFLLFKFV